MQSDGTNFALIGILLGYFERVRIECELALSIAALLWSGLVWMLAFEVLYMARETGCVGLARQVRIAYLCMCSWGASWYGLNVLCHKHVLAKVF